MKVVYSVPAQAELRAIGFYIARDNRARARTFIREINASILRIGQIPHGFPLVPHRRNDDIRRQVFRNYLIFYQVREDHVLILHILHGAQDYDSVLFSDE
ncbi:MAG: type II toxin-antitoxin system RelE/ParE family toxin [Azospirillaceae bacterium]|nr:type II toxin-antitoxin system RelE/ParE family toxin [Azospirillaceae bacterium]